MLLNSPCTGRRGPAVQGPARVPAVTTSQCAKEPIVWVTSEASQQEEAGAVQRRVHPFGAVSAHSWSGGGQRARIHALDMAATSARSSSLPSGRAPAPAARSRDSELAAAVKALMAAGQRDRARERFGEL